MARLSIPDVLGGSRFVLAVLLVAVHAAVPGGRVALGVVVVLAGLTDLFDGLLARRGGEADRVGGILDYTADKFFVALALLVLVDRGDVGVVVAAIVVGRDVAVSGMRLVLFTREADLPARFLGKVRTTVMFPALAVAALGWPGDEALLYLAAALSLISLVDYGRVFLGHLGSVPD